MPLEKPKEHNDLWLSLKRSLTTDYLEDIKLLVRAPEYGGFQDAELEKIKNVREMLIELEVKGVIKVGNYTKLKEIMERIGHRAAIDDIDKTEKLLQEKGYGLASAAENTETTSKRVSQPHQPALDNSSGYGIASAASNTETTSKRRKLQPHQPLDNSSGETAESQMKDGPLQAADKVEEILRKRYMTTGSFVQMVPWRGNDMKPISDIYTKPKLLKTDNQGNQLNLCENEELKSYEDMFLEKHGGHSIQRIVLEGRAGVGKSTLIDKMAYDWAMGEKLQGYKLVFILKMFTLEVSSKFIDAIFNHLIDEDVAISKDDLMSYITNNPEKVLILFDGFDEFKTTAVSEDSRSSGDVFQILNRKILRDSCVVVTTRPSHFHELTDKSLIENPFVHVLDQGFDKEDIKKYIFSFFSKKDDKAEALLQRIKSSDVMFDLATSPMLLLLMCILWREQSKIPDTMYQLYKKALEYIFQRKKLSLADASEVVKSIGGKALDHLLSPQQFLSFKEGDFEDWALRSALKAGILNSEMVGGLDTHHSVSFIHKTFQECCAAIFFQNLLKTDEEQFDKNLDRVANIMKDSPKRLEYLLRFCCGDNQSFTNKVLSLEQKCFGEGALIENDLSVKCYFEGQFEDLPLVDLFTDKIHIKGYNKDGLRALFYYLNHVKVNDKNNQFNKVTSMSFDRIKLEGFGEELRDVMNGMTNLSDFSLTYCTCSPAGWEHINSASYCVNQSSVQTCTYNSQKNGGNNGNTLRIARLPTGVTLVGCDLERMDVVCAAASCGDIKIDNCHLVDKNEFDDWLIEECAE